jgi:hypothetical protein
VSQLSQQSPSATVARIDTFHAAPSTITVRRHVAHVPNTAAEHALPLQKVSGVLCYNMNNIRERANHKTASRLKQLQQWLYRPPGMPADPHDASIPGVAVPRSKRCTPEDCEIRCAAGVIARVSPADEEDRPSRAFVNAFSVVELRPPAPDGTSRDRRRAIDHPKEQNDAVYAAGYKSEVDLRHCSSYLGAVYQSCAVVADIHASFYGLELPRGARAYYRFRDCEGNLYEITRGMMGHTVMAEIQHLITCIVAGHPDYVIERYASPCPHVDVWIDNVRYSGTHAMVTRAREQLVEASRVCNVAMQCEQVATAYDFIGIAFDHEARTVRIADKTLRKLPPFIPSTMVARDLEGLIGRLIFSAAVRQEPLVNSWWTLKWARRVFNQLNRGTTKPSDIVTLNDSQQRGLQYWLSHAAQPHVVKRQLQGHEATLFTDATLGGWGAVLIFDNDRMIIAGNHFTGPQADGDISRKEAWAVVNALDAFAAALSAVNRLNVFVDNTAVEAALRRGMPRADSLVDPIREAWLRVCGSDMSLFVARVSSEANPADEISRGARINISKVANGKNMNTNKQTNQRNGAGSRFAAP